MIIRRYTHQVVIPLLVICVFVFALMLVQRLSSLSVWDDAYMFVRYADNILAFGVASWNPDGAPTYGLTSPAYLLLVIPLRLLFPSEPAQVMFLASLLSGFLAFVIMWRLLVDLVRDTIHRLLMVVVIALTLVVAGDSITTHLTSGMDTMFTVLMMTIWLRLLYLSRSLWFAGILGGLFFAVRPDVLIIVIVCVPALAVNKTVSHSQLRQYVLGVGITLAVQLLGAWLYTGNPLPLPFYAKSPTAYSEQFYDYYTDSSLGYFIEFVLTYPYLIMIVLLGLLTQITYWRWQDKGLFLGVVIFCLYHILFVVPIMGFYQRFFYPILPILLVLAVHSLPTVLSIIPQSIIETVRDYPSRTLFVPLLLLFASINPMPLIITLVQFTQTDTIPMVAVGEFDLSTSYQYMYRDNWYRLDELSKLDDDIVLASTEIGMPGVMNPNKTIVDLAGLNQPNFAINGFSADWLMHEGNQPDWIYMPFPHYVGMWYAIYDHPYFQEDYEFFPARSLGTSMDVAIRRDSEFYLDMREILNEYE